MAIRHHPEVPGAVELADVARYIANNEFGFPDPQYQNAWTWQSDADFDPTLRVVVPRDKAHRNRYGRLLVQKAVMVVVDTLTEYELGIPVVAAPNIDDDPYIEDFVHAFRQYPHGRSPLEVDFDTMDTQLRGLHV